MGRVLIGISAWSDTGLLKSGFYPSEVKTPAERLKYYTSQFEVGEIDSTYHSFATAKNIATWLDNTPEGFAFNLKAFSLFTGHPTPRQSLPRRFREKYGEWIPNKASLYTHHLPEEAIADLWQGFALTAATLLSVRRLGVAFFQFPPWFHPSPQNYEYVASCRRRLPDLPLAVEFRVGSWLDDEHRVETLDLLRRHELSLVCVDEPQGLKSSVPPVDEVTAPLAIVRFHGRNASAWESKEGSGDGRYDYLYTSDELMEWVPRIREMQARSEVVHLIFKNKHADYPVRNALQMKELLGIQ